MTRRYEQQSHPVSILVALSCAICNRAAAQPTSQNWAVGNSGQDSVTVERRWGHNYLEGSFSKSITVDLCPACFMDKLVPWLHEQGATTEVNEWDT